LNSLLSDVDSLLQEVRARVGVRVRVRGDVDSLVLRVEGVWVTGDVGSRQETLNG
jgi:hypothetical protein